PYMFILPHLLFFIAFSAYPFVSGLIISFFQYDILRPDATRIVGLDNYVSLFTPGTVAYPVFWNALGNTAEFVLMSVPVLVIIPQLLALLLNTNLKGKNFFRAIYFAPWVLSSAVVVLLGFWIFQSQGGLLNYYRSEEHTSELQSREHLVCRLRHENKQPDNRYRYGEEH